MSVLDDVSPPAGWDRRPFGRLVRRSKASGRPDLPPLSVYLDDGVVPRSSRDDNHNRLGEDASKYLVVRPGDVVFNKLRTWQGGLGTSRYDGIVSPAYYVCRPQPSMEPRFLHYLLRSRPYLAELTRVSKFMPPSQFDILWDDLREVPIVYPPLVEQRAIADHLDSETDRIDSLIAKKEALHALLGERERSSIEQQLLASATGTVPLRRLVCAMPQYGASESGEKGDSEWPRYIRITDLRSDGSLREDDGIKRLDPEIAGPFLLQDDDILFARSGATSGKAFRYRMAMGPSCFAGYLIRIAFNRTAVLPEFVELWTQTAHYWGQIAETTVQATIQNVSADKYMSLEVPNVPADIHVDLVETLRRERSHTSQVRTMLRRQVDLLRERRQALITAAVTGELKMSGVA